MLLATAIGAVIGIAVTAALYRTRPNHRPEITIEPGRSLNVIPSAQVAKLLREQKPTQRAFLMRPMTAEERRIYAAVRAHYRKPAVVTETFAPAPVRDLSVRAPLCLGCLRFHPATDAACLAREVA